MNKAFIRELSYYLPVRKVSNEELSNEFPNWNPKRAEHITGIKYRNVEEPDVAVSEMALRSAEKLFGKGIKKEDIDFIITVTQSADYRLPSTACVLHGKLGLSDNVGAFDVNLGCSGFVYGLILARSLVQNGTAKNALLITAEKSSFLVHHTDVTLKNILGDAAAAVVVSSEQGFAEIGESDFGTDGKGWNNIIVPAGGSALPYSDATKIPIEDNDGNLKYPEYESMNGMEVFYFSVRRTPPSILSALEKNSLSVGDIDYFLLHQANKIIIDSIIDALKIPGEKVPVNISEVANTSSCSIPILLSDLRDGNRLNAGQKIAMSGFGVGLSWASTVLTVV
jgi:3-oxoacyl-[acyl-carrier-protein] synthase-3